MHRSKDALNDLRAAEQNTIGQAMGTHYTGTDLEITALNAFINLMRAADSVQARIARSILVHNLTTSQFGILEALLHLGPMNVRDLGRKLLKTSGNMTLVIDNLEKRGLAKRVRGTSDRRFVTVHLTEKGEQFISSIFPRHVRAIVDEMSALNPNEQEMLRNLCKRLGKKSAL